MNILIDILPETVNIDDIEYEINTDFRVSILFELMMQDSSIVDDERIDIALSLFYPKIPHNIASAIDKMLWFYKCGKEELEVSSNGSNNKEEQIYSLEYDSDYIYAAFLDQYGVDLQDIEELHWWKFKAMFKGLKEDNKISKIMGYRSIDINNNMSDSEKKHYRELKNIYFLPDNRTEEEKEKDFNNSIATLL